MLRDREIEGPSGREDGWASSARPGGLGQSLHALAVLNARERQKLPMCIGAPGARPRIASDHTLSREADAAPAGPLS